MLIYCATPSRLASKTEDIVEFVSQEKHGPLHPFNALPYKYFEGGPLGREATMEACLRLVSSCDELWIFGISRGTLIEAGYALSNQIPIRPYRNFDPEWGKYYEEFFNEFGEILSKIPLPR